jgi:hypothetical protein
MRWNRPNTTKDKISLFYFGYTAYLGSRVTSRAYSQVVCTSACLYLATAEDDGGSAAKEGIYLASGECG